jgi:hypothetical protein
MEAVKLLRENTTPGHSQDVRALNTNDVEEAGQGLRPVAHGEWLARVGRGSRAWRIPCDDHESIGQVFQLTPPDPRI